ncbi:uncharacterized protein LOC124412716 [Diprion similis]|uniref:uncharacterized protein LOC124412716 n=1 Tax=Diprion similis TaxID=362088 RepID=UPI001EF785B4|nr:uncharacterized protein LOC124412716 [Diprion similis]
MGSTLVNKTIYPSKQNSNSVPESCSPKLINTEIDRNRKSKTDVFTAQNRPLDSTTLLFPFCEENFLLETINKIIKKRWRIIGHTTRYGWLAAAGSYKPTVSPEDAKILLALSNQIGVENCTEAIERIKNLAESLHPRDVPAAAIAVLTETHTALILRQRRGLKSYAKLVQDRFPTIFTISDVCTIQRIDLNQSM